MKRIIVFLVAFFLCSLCWGRAISESVVRIRVANGSENSYGSGAYIGSGMVLTCAHLFNEGPERSGHVWFPDGYQCSFVARQVDPLWDQAVLQLFPIPNKPALVVARTNPQVGETIWAYGYGKTNRVYVTTGTVKRYTSHTMGQPSDWVVISGKVDQGSSGGPLVNSQGEIIGALWGTRSENDGYWTTVGVLAGRTRRFLLPWNSKLQAEGIRNGLYPKGTRVVPTSPGGT